MQGSCAVDKYALDHEATIDYHTKFIKMEQFTLCLWTRFVKHDGDHVLFTYAGELTLHISICDFSKSNRKLLLM